MDRSRYDIPVTVGAGGAKAGHWAKKDGSGGYILAAATTDDIEGVFLHDAEEGATTTLTVAGEADVKVNDASIVIGDAVGTNAAGETIKHAAAAGVLKGGKALEAGTAAEAVTGNTTWLRIIIPTFITE